MVPYQRLPLMEREELSRLLAAGYIVCELRPKCCSTHQARWNGNSPDTVPAPWEIQPEMVF